LRQWRSNRLGRLRQINQRPAVRAYCQVRKRLLLLVRRQHMLGKGAELVCIGMPAGLE
jgi:hypothetical protein